MVKHPNGFQVVLNLLYSVVSTVIHGMLWKGHMMTYALTTCGMYCNWYRVAMLVECSANNMGRVCGRFTTVLLCDDV